MGLDTSNIGRTLIVFHGGTSPKHSLGCFLPQRSKDLIIEVTDKLKAIGIKEYEGIDKNGKKIGIDPAWEKGPIRGEYDMIMVVER